MNNRESIITATSWNKAQMIRTGILNIFKIKVSLVSFNSKDTEFSYLIIPEKKITKMERIILFSFSQGIQYALD